MTADDLIASIVGDWPYAEDNFDLSKKMTALDRMLIRATGDGSTWLLLVSPNDL